MKFRFLDHTADTRFEAFGKNLEELFENAALATETIMVRLSTLKIEEEYTITLESESIENLLYDFLSELIFVKDTEGLLFREFDIIIANKKKMFSLIAACKGEHIDRERHELGNDAKAITKHEFHIDQLEPAKWIAKVIVDI